MFLLWLVNIAVKADNPNEVGRGAARCSCREAVGVGQEQGGHAQRDESASCGGFLHSYDVAVHCS